MRRVAGEAGTTSRAVYSVFGSKDGLVVALATHAFQLLGTAIEALPETADPAADLVDAGVAVFRRFAIEHPSLFRLAVQRTLAPPALTDRSRPAAAEAMAGLKARLARLDAAKQLGDRTTDDAACEFHALCEGLAAVELRGMMRTGDEERLWRDALTALVTGFAAPRPAPQRQRRGGRPSLDSASTNRRRG